MLTVALGVLGLAAEAFGQSVLPPGFQERTVLSGLNRPTAVKFSPDGRVFVAEKSGIIRVFPSLTSTTPTVFADLRTQVMDYWDRGLLGLELHPGFPSTPYVYVIYTLDAAVGGTPPRWNDTCGDPTGNGCRVGARVSRLTASGSVMTGQELVLLEDWCQQYPSHSIGSVFFGADGALYISGGDGASFTFVDFGQGGTAVTRCSDPPSEGGGLRGQDIETAGDPVAMSGAILRIDPITGAALPDNPLVGGDPADDRIVAYGLRNPYRLTVRPGTSEVWIGDVGWDVWEEINRLDNPTGGVVNFGWPCYEGAPRQGGYDSANLPICEALYSRGLGAVRAPFYAYNHGSRVVTGESCPTGSSSITGLAFYTGAQYPAASYQGALFFADYSRRCIWAMRPDGAGLPNPNDRVTFVAGAATPVQLTAGPAGDIFYLDHDGGRLQRIQYFAGNQPPTAVLQADRTSGTAPLLVNFSAAASTDPNPGDDLTYAWDLDGDGQLDDAFTVTAAWSYAQPGNVTVRLRVTDSFGASDTKTVVISPGNSPPLAEILTPFPVLKWRAGQVIDFTGRGMDPQQGLLPPASLSWTAVLQHCPDECHEHVLQTFPGTGRGSFTAPDHDYPSHLELRLTATDAQGLSHTDSLWLNPRLVQLGFNTVPPGLQLAVGSSTTATPFTRRVIVGSQNSISAPSPQVLGGTTYAFVGWSDGGAQTHNIVAPASPATYVATFAVSGQPAVTIEGALVAEGNAGSREVVLTVALSAPSQAPVTVGFTTADGTAVAPDDYASASGTLTFAPGETVKTITVAIRGDSIREGDERLSVRLGPATGATVDGSAAEVVILDDDGVNGG